MPQVSIHVSNVTMSSKRYKKRKKRKSYNGSRRDVTMLEFMNKNNSRKKRLEAFKKMNMIPPFIDFNKFKIILDWNDYSLQTIRKYGIIRQHLGNLINTLLDTDTIVFKRSHCSHHGFSSNLPLINCLQFYVDCTTFTLERAVTVFRGPLHHHLLKISQKIGRDDIHQGFCYDCAIQFCLQEKQDSYSSLTPNGMKSITLKNSNDNETQSSDGNDNKKQKLTFLEYWCEKMKNNVIGNVTEKHVSLNNFNITVSFHPSIIKIMLKTQFCYKNVFTMFLSSLEALTLPKWEGNLLNFIYYFFTSKQYRDISWVCRFWQDYEYVVLEPEINVCFAYEHTLSTIIRLICNLLPFFKLKHIEWLIDNNFLSIIRKFLANYSQFEHTFTNCNMVHTIEYHRALDPEKISDEYKEMDEETRMNTDLEFKMDLRAFGYNRDGSDSSHYNPISRSKRKKDVIAWRLHTSKKPSPFLRHVSRYGSCGQMRPKDLLEPADVYKNLPLVIKYLCNITKYVVTMIFSYYKGLSMVLKNCNDDSERFDCDYHCDYDSNHKFEKRFERARIQFDKLKKATQQCIEYQKERKEKFFFEYLIYYPNYDTNGYEDVVHQKELHQQYVKCAQCYKMKPLLKQFKICGGCCIVAYCSRKCQKLHWKSRHRHQCKQLSKLFNV